MGPKNPILVCKAPILIFCVFEEPDPGVWIQPRPADAQMPGQLCDWISETLQRLQYTLIKENSLNHIRDPTLIHGIFLS